MITRHLNQTELAARWTISPRTFERWRFTGEVGCVITTGGARLNDGKKHQIGFSGMVRAATNARSRADDVFGLLRTQAECYRARRSLVIWGMSAQII